MSNELDEKKAAIMEEMDKLDYEFKVDLPKKIAEARSYGDLKENAEYHAARERQSFVKARMGQLADQLNKLNNINIEGIDDSSIGFGSTVYLTEKSSGREFVFTFVSENEVNPSGGKISLNSPYGLALNGKPVGAEVEVTMPAGKKTFKVNKLITIHGTELV